MSPLPMYLHLMTGILLLASSILRISGKPLEGDASATQLISKSNDGKMSAEVNNDTVNLQINNFKGSGASTHRQSIEIMTKQFFGKPSATESDSSDYSSDYSSDLSFLSYIWGISESDSSY
ncbi:PREDICTED: uncharacterized protein LOC108972414 [Bactrocera latifrons]|uniref:Uncharacterized protein n=1 Tax=Bactrocera latifrons TaxID=174628 RepID=A0A0K8U296_BACLA|nr:PREDICTED: uncharacterized protein LOC108972414 [Bactrocera latifrons]